MKLALALHRGARCASAPPSERKLATLPTHIMLAAVHLVQAFTIAPRVPVATTSAPLRLAAPLASAFGRREFTVGAAALAAICQQPQAALADGDVKTVVVAGATGQTGRRCLERLAKMEGVTAIGGVRNPEKVSVASGHLHPHVTSPHLTHPHPSPSPVPSSSPQTPRSSQPSTY